MLSTLATAHSTALKLDYHIEDSLGRTWQCGTIQLDMNLPERFNVEYIGEDGQKHRTIMIHRACFGSMERFHRYFD